MAGLAADISSRATTETVGVALAAPEVPAQHRRLVLAVGVLGFFVITFDAVVVNVALPVIDDEIGTGITGLQWVVDGYTLMFAGLLLWSGALSDRIGAKRAFTFGLALFMASSAACGVAPTLEALVAARFVQGAAAALMMPASLALIGQAHPDPVERGRAIGIWALGGALASSSGPVLGGLLSLASWRLIFVINVPIGVGGLLLLSRLGRSPRRDVPFDWIGQASGVLAMGGLTYGAIEAGAEGFTEPRVVLAFVVAVVALVAFLVTESRIAHPMVPLSLFRSRNVSIAMVVGFAFVAGYSGLPFVMSLYLQQLRDLTPFTTGLTFLPMMVTGAVLSPFSARISERAGARRTVSVGLVILASGLAILAATPATTPAWALGILMMLVGLGGPLIIPPVTAVLLNSVRSDQAGTASGVFNTSRQIGGALAVAVFGALVGHGDFIHGLRVSLLIAAATALAAAGASLFLEVPTSSQANPSQGAR